MRVVQAEHACNLVAPVKEKHQLVPLEVFSLRKRLQSVGAPIRRLKVGQLLEERERVDLLMKLHACQIQHQLHQHELIVQHDNVQVACCACSSSSTCRMRDVNSHLVHLLLDLFLLLCRFRDQPMRLLELYYCCFRFC